MPNVNGATNKEVELGVEMNAYPVIYYDNGNESIKRDNKWVIKDKGAYTVTVNVETMKVKVEELVYLVGTALTGEVESGYDLNKAPYFTKTSDGKYELTVDLQAGDFKILSQLNYNLDKPDYFAPGENTPFAIGSMKVDYRQGKDGDYKWQVTAEQTGTYKLTLDVSDSSNVTLTAEKLENQQ